MMWTGDRVDVASTGEAGGRSPSTHEGVDFELIYVWSLGQGLHSQKRPSFAPDGLQRRVRFAFRKLPYKYIVLWIKLYRLHAVGILYLWKGIYGIHTSQRPRSQVRTPALRENTLL